MAPERPARPSAARAECAYSSSYTLLVPGWGTSLRRYRTNQSIRFYVTCSTETGQRMNQGGSSVKHKNQLTVTIKWFISMDSRSILMDRATDLSWGHIVTGWTNFNINS